MKTLRIAFCVLRSTCRARFLHKDMQDIRTTGKIQDTTYHKIYVNLPYVRLVHNHRHQSLSRLQRRNILSDHGNGCIINRMKNENFRDWERVQEDISHVIF